MKYIVTALINRKGYRDDISIPMSLQDAEKFKKRIKQEIKISNNMHGFSDIRIDRVKKEPVLSLKDLQEKIHLESVNKNRRFRKMQPILHWFGEHGGTTCGLAIHKVETADIRTRTTCLRCISSLKKAGLW